MRICDRCGCPDPMYHNVYVGGRNRELCALCYEDLEKLEEVFNSIECNFMKNKTLKHIDVDWS